MEKKDVFISHASEDKETVARPLTKKLEAMGLKVWLDEQEIKLGDSLTEKINEGLANSDFGVVILSKNFLAKDWTQKELDGLFAREVDKRKVILPIWHKIDRDYLLKFSPILADKVAEPTEKGIDYIAEQIKKAVEKTEINEIIKQVATTPLPKDNENSTNLVTYDDNDRQAMRAFLQRAEVRLSTMHRIAGVFLNGAGLLLLFPVFSRESIMSIISFLIGAINLIFNNWNWSPSQIIHLICFFLLFLPLSASLILPLYALYLLLKDLIHFYFTGHNPGYPSRLFNPRFGLTGIAFSPDESQNIKKDIIEYEYSSDLINFVLPFDEKEASYFDRVKENTKDLIIPDSRTKQTLKEQYNLNFDDFANLKKDKDKQVDIDRFNTALGLAGFLDRPLFQEVAKIETSLVRHTLCLRRLVLRYMKALLMFIITMLISFLTVSIIQNLPVYGVYIFAVGYFVWAYFTPRLIKKPVDWIWELSNRNSPNEIERDEQLVLFENKVKYYCNRAMIVLGIVIILEISSNILFYYNR